MQTTATLNATDRCDECRAQAYMVFTLKTGGTLQYCVHHATKYEVKLLPISSSYRDYRYLLDADPLM